MLGVGQVPRKPPWSARLPVPPTCTPSGGGPGAGGIQVLGSQNPRGFGDRQVVMPGGIALGLLPRTSTLRCPTPRWPLRGAPHPWDVAKHPWVPGGSGRAGHTLHRARRGWILPQGCCVHVCACTCACTCECTCACTLCQRLPPARSRAGWDPAGAAVPHWVHWGRRALLGVGGRMWHRVPGSVGGRWVLGPAGLNWDRALGLTRVLLAMLGAPSTLYWAELGASPDGLGALQWLCGWQGRGPR